MKAITVWSRVWPIWAMAVVQVSAVGSPAAAQNRPGPSAVETCTSTTSSAPLGLIPRGLSSTAFPVVGQSTTVEVGESMISQQSTSLFDRVDRISGPFSFKTNVGKTQMRVEVAEGDLHPSPGKIGLQADKYEFYYNENTKPTKFGRPDISYFYREPDRLMASINYGLGITDVEFTGAKMALVRCMRSGPSDFRQELIYGGVSKGSVRLTYREFKGDLARPAFTQELSYDLADGNEIGFRGGRFRIESANNLSINYTVIKQLSVE